MNNGSAHLVSTTKMPLTNARGDVVGTFGICRDVTKLKKMEIELLNKDKSLIEEKKQYEQQINNLEKRIKFLRTVKKNKITLSKCNRCRK